MADLQLALLLELHVLGQEVVFPLDGRTVGTIQVEPIWGVLGTTVFEIIRGNDPTAMVALEAPVTLVAFGMTPTLDMTASYVGVRVQTAGGPGLAKVRLRAFDSK